MFKFMVIKGASHPLRIAVALIEWESTISAHFLECGLVGEESEAECQLILS